jgi:hypothetical protein
MLMMRVLVSFALAAALTAFDVSPARAASEPETFAIAIELEKTAVLGEELHLAVVATHGGRGTATSAVTIQNLEVQPIGRLRDFYKPFVTESGFAELTVAPGKTVYRSAHLGPHGRSMAPVPVAYRAGLRTAIHRQACQRR